MSLGAGELVSIILEEYAQPGKLTPQSATAKILQGIAIWADLDLDKPVSLIRRHVGDALAVSDHRLIKTEQCQVILDSLCQLTLEDPLTGLFNRRYFEMRLSQELQRTDRVYEPCSVVLADIDNFKTVNDDHGHDAGDRLLGHVARVIRETLRGSDVAVRYGGDEFAFILPGTADRDALRAAERVRIRIASTPLLIEQRELRVTTSAGIATFHPGSFLSQQQLVKQADIALFTSKRRCRDANAVFGELSTTCAVSGVSADERRGLLG